MSNDVFAIIVVLVAVDFWQSILDYQALNLPKWVEAAVAVAFGRAVLITGQQADGAVLRLTPRTQGFI